MNQTPEIKAAELQAQEREAERIMNELYEVLQRADARGVPLTAAFSGIVNALACYTGFKFNFSESHVQEFGEAMAKEMPGLVPHFKELYEAMRSDAPKIII